jgi:hypothetical protein
MIRALVISFGLLAAGTLAGSVRAQPQNQDQVAASSGVSTATKPKAKKVWTNDNMSEVTGTISVVGTERPKPTPTVSKISSLQPAVPSAGNAKQAASAKSGTDSVDPKTLAQVKQQVQKLQASIDQLDRQIEQLQGASRGDSKNVGVLTSDPSRYSMEPVPEQIKSLEAKKSGLQAAMEQLLDAARASGIEPGQLR